MTNVLFTVSNQTIYINYTGNNGIVRKEIFCISSDLQNAEIICTCLNNQYRGANAIKDAKIADLETDYNIGLYTPAEFEKKKAEILAS